MLIKNIKDLFQKQLQTWNRLKKAHQQLHTILTKKIYLLDSNSIIQCNPGRSKNSRAKVDPLSIIKRKCFLCKENLNPEQDYRKWNEFIILCNPAPIFPLHFTVSCIKHTPQKIINSFLQILNLSKDISPEFICLYNGPECGASSPDHLHFQIIPRYSLAIENVIDNTQDIIKLNYSFLTIDDRKIVVLKNNDRFHLMSDFTKLCVCIFSLNNLINREPMLNIISYFENNYWIVIIFLRKTHRPSCYYANRKNKIFISPGAVDMGGVIISIRKRDYERLDRNIILKIYNEVSMSEDNFLTATKKYNSMQNNLR